MPMMNRMMLMNFSLNALGSLSYANNNVPLPSANLPNAFHAMLDLNRKIADFTGDKSTVHS